MHISRILGIIAFLLAVIGCFLPWAAVSIGPAESLLGDDRVGLTTSLTGDDLGGWYPVVLLVVVAVLACLGKRKKGFGRGVAIPVLICGLVATLLMIYKGLTIEKQFFQSANPLSDVLGVDLGSLLDVDLKIGFFIESAGSALAIFAGLIGSRD